MSRKSGFALPKGRWFLINAFLVMAVFLCFPLSAVAQDYQGSESCAQCHEQNWNEWQVSGHPWKLMKGEDALNRPIPLPEGLRWDDVSYVIGGYKWKSRYMNNDGYIYTPTEGRNQYNMLTGEWSDYHAGEMKPYDCGSCHTTGWVADEDADTDDDLTDNQDMLPGIHGTFEFPGVHCEQCHGPGVASMNVDSSAEACGSCHYRTSPPGSEVNTIPAKGGFVRHHEQYNEFLASPHADALDCTDCHNPHERGEWSIWKDGERREWSDLDADKVGQGAQCGVDCHSGVMESYAQTSMYDYNVSCEDCHMSFATKSAQATGPHAGDVMTHLFYINTDPDASMFTEDGSLVALDEDGKGAVTMDFACQRCHETASLQELARFADNFHSRAPDSLEGLGIDFGLSGHWWNGPARSGEGFLIDVSEVPDGRTYMFVSFYAYAPDGEQVWLVAQGAVTAGSTMAELSVFLPTDGAWGANLDPESVDRQPFGTLSVDFPGCFQGMMSLDVNADFEGQGFTDLAYDLQRDLLVPGVTCPSFDNTSGDVAAR